jgi:hypothetical protein
MIKFDKQIRMIKSPQYTIFGSLRMIKSPV